MFSKRQLPIDLNSCSPTKRLRHNLVDLFLSSDVSGERADSLLRDAVSAKAENVVDLVGNEMVKKHKGNACRDLLRKLKRTTVGWPPLYYADIRTFDPKKQQEVISKIPFYLPHELLASLLQMNSPEHLLQAAGLNRCALSHVQKAEEIAQRRFVPFGFWGDGVPCNWDRTQSLECFSLSLPGCVGADANIRFPLTAINKKHCIKHKTFDDILAVLTWSFQMCALGIHPTTNHVGQPFIDKQRIKWGGKEIGIHAVVAEVRGDWKFYKETFRLPGWKEKRGCCWRCLVTPCGIRDASSTAPWRNQRIDQWTFIRRMQEGPDGLSPFLSIPYFQGDIFQIDWLHTADLGITANFLGNLFWETLNRLPGESQKEKCSFLFAEIQKYYKEQKISSRLDNLTLSMLCQPGKQPKLRGKAAECRYLVPFAKLLVSTYFNDESNQYDKTIYKATMALSSCYDCLSAEKFDQLQLARSSREFALLAVALETFANSNKWKVKPKLHLFQEMCECSNSQPSTCWTYRDEDFGGSMAATSKRRGGPVSHGSLATSILTKFAIKNPMPRLGQSIETKSFACSHL